MKSGVCTGRLKDTTLRIVEQVFDVGEDGLGTLFSTEAEGATVGIRVGEEMNTRHQVFDVLGVGVTFAFG